MYSRRQSWGAPLSVAIPAGYPIGAIFGQKGCNIRRLSAMTDGGHLNVDEERMLVTVSGANPGAAIADLLRHFTAHAQKAISSYPHPEIIRHVCQGVSSVDSAVEFSPFMNPGATREVAGRPSDQLFTLGSPSRVARFGGVSALGAMSSLSLRQPSPKGNFYVAANMPALSAELLAAAVAGRAFKPSFDRMKLRANIGKQFYYPPRGKRLLMGSVPFSRVQGLEVGHSKDLKALFSNGLDSWQSAAVRSHLTGRMGFGVGEKKDVVSLHLTDDDLGTSHTIVFRKGSDGLSLGKLKSGDAKLFFLACSSDSTADFRIKLLGQYHFDEASSAAVKMTELGNRCTLRGGTLEVPQDRRDMQGFSWNLVRHKAKTKLDGTYTDSNGVQIAVRVSLLEVHSLESAERGGRSTRHHEVAIYVPALIAALSARDASEGSSAGEENSTMLGAMVEFCQELQSVISI